MSTVPRVRAQPPATESLAGTGRRVLALLVDQLVAFLLAAGASSIGYGLALDAVRSSPTDDVAPEVGAILALPLAVLTVVGVAQWVAEAVTGRTLGGLALGVRTVDADTGLTVGLVRIFVRNVVLGAGSLVCGVGQFVVGASGAWDSAGRLQGWHDKVARTVVVRAGAGSTAVRAPRTEPGHRTVDAGGPVPTSSAAALRRGPGSGGAESLMRAARAGASPSPTAAVEPAATGVPGAEAPGPDPDRQHAEAGADADDVTPPTGALRRPVPPVLAAPAPASPVAPAPGPPVEPAHTIDVPAWSTPTPAATSADPADPATPPDVITAAPSWTATAPQPATPQPAGLEPVTPQPAGLQPVTPQPADQQPATTPGPADAAGAPLDQHAPTAPTRRLRKGGPRPDPDVPADPGALAADPGPGPARGDRPDAPAGRTGTPTGPATPVGPAGAPADPARPGAPRALRVVFDTGEAFVVAGRGVVGRNPSTADSGVVAHVVPIDDPARSVSKTHLEFGAEDGAFWVLDRRSTNGSALVHADGTRERLTAGVRTAVPVGAVVEFGDRRFRVLDA